MFERFTDTARRAIVLAQEEARHLNHDDIGSEHLLLGILHHGEGEGVNVLTTWGVSLETARTAVEELAGRGQAPPGGHIPFAPGAKEVFELALRESILLHHDFIGPEHLLLGLLLEGDGVGVQVLTGLGADPPAMREQILAMLHGEATLSTGFRGGTVGGDEPSAIGDPRCPSCKARLIESASYRILEVAEHGGEGHRRVLFLFCLRCGVAIDNEILPEDEA